MHFRRALVTLLLLLSIRQSAAAASGRPFQFDELAKAGGSPFPGTDNGSSTPSGLRTSRRTAPGPPCGSSPSRAENRAA